MCYCVGMWWMIPRFIAIRDVLRKWRVVCVGVLNLLEHLVHHYAFSVGLDTFVAI